MKFRYVKIPTGDPHKKWISRPMISIVLYGPRGSIIVDALIDSGADRSLFHISLARAIGIDVSKYPKATFSGIESGELHASLCDVKIEILGMRGTTKVAAGFVDSPGVSAILGQEGFFDNYRIKFEKDRDIVEIVPAPKAE